MSGYRDPNFNDRLSEAAKAKEALLAKFRAAPGPDDPTSIEKRRARQAVLEARAAREAERERVRQVREAEFKRQAEIAAKEAEEAARLAAELAAREATEKAEFDALLKAEQKVARDVRYAARKAAKKQRRRGY
jgi:hypothetical protein